MQRSRRRFLQWGLSLAALVFFRTPAAWGRAPSDAGLPLEQRLVRLLRNRESAAVIGRAYLRLEPAEAEARQLAATIAREAGIDPAGGSRAELRRRLSACTRRDFGEGRTVRLDGWILSRTEARLYALAALV